MLEKVPRQSREDVDILVLPLAILAVLLVLGLVLGSPAV